MANRYKNYDPMNELLEEDLEDLAIEQEDDLSHLDEEHNILDESLGQRSDGCVGFFEGYGFVDYEEAYPSEYEGEYRDPDYYNRFIPLPDEKMQIDS